MLLALYHAVIRQVVRTAFRHISSARHAEVAAQFADDAVFSFAGDHAMGGTLHGRTAIGEWFERVHRLFPDLQIVPEAIVVDGWPWATTAATRFHVGATLADGRAYSNDGVQYVRIAWGRIIEDRLFEDTDRLRTALQRLAAQGIAEAHAAPLGAV